MNIYISKNGQQLGPYSQDEINRQRDAGTLTDADLAWHDGLPEWVPLAQIAGPRVNLASRPAAPVAGGPVLIPVAPQTPTGLRIVTALVVFGVSFFVVFFLIFFIACLVGGFISGYQAGLQHPGGGTEVGRQAGADFAKNYIPMIMGCSALFSLAASAVLAFFMSFSNLFPWCRAR